MPNYKSEEEILAYHRGYMEGITAYAKEDGHSMLKSKNSIIRKLMERAADEAIRAGLLIVEQKHAKL